jgi:predicted  nucleic acid-binding Zn ribbon protein
MILANIVFGVAAGTKKHQAEELVADYIGHLYQSGQACGDYYLTWTDGVLNVHVGITTRNANAARYHSEQGKRTLRRLREFFGKAPQWTTPDDDARERPPRWQTAPFLYLCPEGYRMPPVRRGDTGARIATCLLPLSDFDREYLFFWSDVYYHHLQVWYDSGALEGQAYRQLADPWSELSSEGREHGRIIERASGIPVYYYLMRYWGRRTGEDSRPCPGCRKRWNVPDAEWVRDGIPPFQFICKKCRLISHRPPDSGPARLAAIGEYRAPTS